MIDFKYSLIAIFIMAFITQFLRFFPFLLFSKRIPKIFSFLGEVLPFSIIAMLVVYCFRNIDLKKSSSVFPEFISVVIIFILHKWKHNSLLSIVVGTILYMILNQKIFKI